MRKTQVRFQTPTWEINCSWTRGEGLSILLPLPSTERSLTCGVFAGVGARNPVGEFPIRPWRWRKGRFSKESFESSASSSTCCNRVLTWPLNKASPEPGVLLARRLLSLIIADDGVCIATPTIGESLVMSIRADRSCCCCCFPFLGLDLDKPVSESSFFPEN